MPGLRVQFALRVATGKNDPGRDIPQFACHGLFEKWITRLFSPVSFFRMRPPDERIVSRYRTGHVNIFDSGMMDQFMPDIRTPLDNSQQSCLKNRSERRGDQFCQMLVYGTDF